MLRPLRWCLLLCELVVISTLSLPGSSVHFPPDQQLNYPADSSRRLQAAENPLFRSPAVHAPYSHRLQSAGVPEYQHIPPSKTAHHTLQLPLTKAGYPLTQPQYPLEESRYPAEEYLADELQYPAEGSQYPSEWPQYLAEEPQHPGRWPQFWSEELQRELSDAPQYLPEDVPYFPPQVMQTGAEDPMAEEDQNELVRFLLQHPQLLEMNLYDKAEAQPLELMRLPTEQDDDEAEWKQRFSNHPSAYSMLQEPADSSILRHLQSNDKRAASDSYGQQQQKNRLFDQLAEQITELSSTTIKPNTKEDQKANEATSHTTGHLNKHHGPRGMLEVPMYRPPDRQAHQPTSPTTQDPGTSDNTATSTEAPYDTIKRYLVMEDALRELSKKTIKTKRFVSDKFTGELKRLHTISV